MEHYVKKLPKNATFDYVDIFGGKHYHTDRRQYVVYRGTIKSISKKIKLWNTKYSYWITTQNGSTTAPLQPNFMLMKPTKTY